MEWFFPLIPKLMMLSHNARRAGVQRGSPLWSGRGLDVRSSPGAKVRRGARIFSVAEKKARSRRGSGP